MADVLQVESLSEAALDAAAEFSTKWLPKARAALADSDSLTIVLPLAPYDHDDWRRALARDLAREAAPKRVNIIAADDENRIEETSGYLRNAPGITGQYLPLTSDK